MARLRGIAIVRSIQVCWDNTDEVSAVLLVIELTLDKAHALGVRIAFIAHVRCSIVQFASIDRVRDLIWVDAAREDTDKSRNTVLMSALNHIRVHCEVLLKEADLIIHIGKKSSNFRSQMNHKCRLDPRKHVINGGELTQVPILLPTRKVKLHIRDKSSKEHHETVPILPLPKLFQRLITTQSRRLRNLLEFIDETLEAEANHAI